MITIKEFMEICDYKITEGSEYCWQCYGPNAYRLDSWNQDQEGHTVSIVFDTRNHVIYEATAYDYKRNRAYRLINPDYKFAHDDEAAGRGVDINQAWDDVNYIDLDVDDDFIQKALAIVADEDYDTRVSVSVEFTDEELLTYMKIAHDRDITFNQLVEEALQAAIDEHHSCTHKTATDDSIDFPKTKKKKKDKK